MNIPAWLMICVLCVSPLGYSFSQQGHKIVALLAYEQLSTQTQQQITTLLGSSSLAALAVWPDQIKSQAAWQHTQTWHYINLADHSPIPKKKSSKQQHLIWALKHIKLQLQTKGLSQTAKRQALGFYMHLFADLHQPLHVGRAEDRGGNRIMLLVDNRLFNLHRLWDSYLIRSQRLSIEQHIQLLKQVYPNSTMHQFRSDSDWQIVEQQLALRPSIYQLKPPKVSASYIKKHQQTSNRQLALAAYRLAYRLELLFN